MICPNRTIATMIQCRCCWCYKHWLYCCIVANNINKIHKSITFAIEMLIERPLVFVKIYVKVRRKVCWNSKIKQQRFSLFCNYDFLRTKLDLKSCAKILNIHWWLFSNINFHRLSTIKRQKYQTYDLYVYYSHKLWHNLYA